MGMYYGYEDGIKSDRSVADAVDVIGLTSDMDKVKMAVESLSFLKGFTRMAQEQTNDAYYRKTEFINKCWLMCFLGGCGSLEA